MLALFFSVLFCLFLYAYPVLFANPCRQSKKAVPLSDAKVVVFCCHAQGLCCYHHYAFHTSLKKSIRCSILEVIERGMSIIKPYLGICVDKRFMHINKRVMRRVWCSQILSLQLLLWHAQNNKGVGGYPSILKLQWLRQLTSSCEVSFRAYFRYPFYDTSGLFGSFHPFCILFVCSWK